MLILQNVWLDKFLIPMLFCQDQVVLKTAQQLRLLFLGMVGVKALLQPDFDVRLAHKINHVISNIESILLSRFYLNDLLSQKMLYYNNYMSMANTIASLELELQKPANERDFSESTLILMLNQNKMQQILNLQYINFYDGLIAFATGTVSIDNYLQSAILNRLNERIDLLINLSKYSMVPDIFSTKLRKDEIDF